MILGSKFIFLGLSFGVSKGGEKLCNGLFFRCTGSSPKCPRLLPSRSVLVPLFRRPLLAHRQRRLSETPSPSYGGFPWDSRHSPEVSLGDPTEVSPIGSVWAGSGQEPPAGLLPVRLKSVRAPHLLQGKEEKLLGQQLRVQQQLRVCAAAIAHIPRHDRRQETPVGYPQSTAAEASRK